MLSCIIHSTIARHSLDRATNPEVQRSQLHDALMNTMGKWKKLWWLWQAVGSIERARIMSKEYGV